MVPSNYYDIFKGLNNSWYWHLIEGDSGKVIATGKEAFVSYANALRSIKEFEENVARAYIPDSEPEEASMAPDDLVEGLDEGLASWSGDQGLNDEIREPLERDVD